MSIIEWHQAQELPEENRKEQEKYIANFLEEDNSLANGRDLQYWSDKTGKDLNWIMENGKNIDPVIKESYFHTNSLDDVWNFEPVNWEDENDYSEDGDWEDEHPDSFMLDLFKNTIN